LQLIKQTTPPRTADVLELAVDAPPRTADVRELAVDGPPRTADVRELARRLSFRAPSTPDPLADPPNPPSRDLDVEVVGLGEHPFTVRW
jgi:hypothetical protein